jgi:hypothetical protein
MNGEVQMANSMVSKMTRLLVLVLTNLTQRQESRAEPI